MHRREYNMKPRLGRKVYCIYGKGILVDTVGFLGKDSFIIDSFCLATESDSWEWDYDMYEQEWFTNLSKAKKKLIDNYKDKYEEKIKVTKVSDIWYELDFC